jgi:THO complex subunit 1
VVPPELLPPEVNAKFASKPAEKAKRPKREDSKGASAQAKEQLVHGVFSASSITMFVAILIF